MQIKDHKEKSTHKVKIVNTDSYISIFGPFTKEWEEDMRKMSQDSVLGIYESKLTDGITPHFKYFQLSEFGSRYQII